MMRARRSLTVTVNISRLTGRITVVSPYGFINTRLYLPPLSPDMMGSSSAEVTSRSGDCSPQGIMLDYITAVVAIAQILVSQI